MDVSSYRFHESGSIERPHSSLSATVPPSDNLCPLGSSQLVWLVAVLAATGLCGCASWQMGAVPKEEALANQVTGMLEHLDSRLAEYESVRDTDREHGSRLSTDRTQSMEAVVRARQRQEFNSDDVRMFLRQGIVGENNHGLLEFRPDWGMRQDAVATALARTVVAQENEDRMTLMRRIIAVSEDLGKQDLAIVQGIFAELNQKAAAIGTWIQTSDGEWEQKDG